MGNLRKLIILPLMFVCSSVFAAAPLYWGLVPSTSTARGEGYICGDLNIYNLKTDSTAAFLIEGGSITKCGTVDGRDVSADGSTIDALIVSTATIQSSLDAVIVSTGAIQTSLNAVIVSTGAIQSSLTSVIASTGAIQSSLDAVILSTGALESSKVDRAGDTMTGTLNGTDINMTYGVYAATGVFTQTVITGTGTIIGDGLRYWMFNTLDLGIYGQYPVMTPYSDGSLGNYGGMTVPLILIGTETDPDPSLLFFKIGTGISTMIYDKDTNIGGDVIHFQATGIKIDDSECIGFFDETQYAKIFQNSENLDFVFIDTDGAPTTGKISSPGFTDGTASWYSSALTGFDSISANALSAANFVSASSFTSTIGYGEAPLVVVSSTMVNNLNANYWKGMDIDTATLVAGDLFAWDGSSVVRVASGTAAGTYLKEDLTWDTPAGAGDMLKATYDTGDDGIVDDSELLDGLDYTNFVDTHSAQSIAGAKTFTDFNTSDDSMWRMIYSTKNVSNVTSFTLSSASSTIALNGDVDGEYWIVIRSTSSEVQNPKLYFNADTTATNYLYARAYDSVGWGKDNGDSSMGFSSGIGKSVAFIHIVAGSHTQVQSFANGSYLPTATGIANLFRISLVWENTANITSIKLENSAGTITYFDLAVYTRR